MAYWVYHRTQEAKIVETEEEFADHLAKGWADTPAAFFDEETVYTKAELFKMKASERKELVAKYGVSPGLPKAKQIAAIIEAQECEQ